MTQCQQLTQLQPTIAQFCAHVALCVYTGMHVWSQNHSKYTGQMWAEGSLPNCINVHQFGWPSLYSPWYLCVMRILAQPTAFSPHAFSPLSVVFEHKQSIQLMSTEQYIHVLYMYCLPVYKHSKAMCVSPFTKSTALQWTCQSVMCVLCTHTIFA